MNAGSGSVPGPASARAVGRPSDGDPTPSERAGGAPRARAGAWEDGA